MAARVILLKSKSELSTLFKNLQWLPISLKGKRQTLYYDQMICILHSLSDSISIINFSTAPQATSLFLKQIRHSPTSVFPYSLHSLPEMLFPQSSTWLALASPSVLYSSYHLSEAFSGHTKICTHPLHSQILHIPLPLFFSLEVLCNIRYILHILFLMFMISLSLLSISSMKTGVLVDFVHCCLH